MRVSMFLAHKIAHMFHIFLGILHGVEAPPEPLDVTYGGQHEDRPDAGEIGLAFECHARGGSVYSNSRDVGNNWKYFTTLLPIIAKVDKYVKLDIGADEGKSYVIPFEMVDQFIGDPSGEFFSLAINETF